MVISITVTVNLNHSDWQLQWRHNANIGLTESKLKPQYQIETRTVVTLTAFCRRRQQNCLVCRSSQTTERHHRHELRAWVDELPVVLAVHPTATHTDTLWWWPNQQLREFSFSTNYISLHMKLLESNCVRQQFKMHNVSLPQPNVPPCLSQYAS